jgi:phosphopantetheine binding protein
MPELRGASNARARENLVALARRRVEDASRAFSKGRQVDSNGTKRAGEPMSSQQLNTDEMQETVNGAWQEIGRSAPTPGENYWEAGVTSLEVALFSEALSRHLGFDVEFADVLEYPDTGALAGFLCTRRANGGRENRTAA